MNVAIVTATPSKGAVEAVFKSWGVSADIIAVDKPFAAALSFSDLYALRGVLEPYDAVIVPPAMRASESVKACRELGLRVVKGTANLLSLPTLVRHVSELLEELSPRYHAERVTTVVPGMYVLRRERKLVAAIAKDMNTALEADGYADLLFVKKLHGSAERELYSKVIDFDTYETGDVCRISKPADLLELKDCRIVDITPLLDLGLDPSTIAYMVSRMCNAEVVLTSKSYCRVACGVRAAALALKYGLAKIPLYSPSVHEGAADGTYVVRFSGCRVIEACKGSSSPLELDPKGYFIISVDYDRGVVVAYHFKYGSWEPDVAVAGREWESILRRILELGLVSKDTHVAYLAVELYKAVDALRRGALYIQELEPTTCVACLSFE